MHVVEDTLDTDLETFLARPLFAHLSTVDGTDPRESPVWFLWEEDALWVVGDSEADSFPVRVEADPRCAVGIVDYDRGTGRVEHVGFRGRATVEPFDPERVTRLLRRYLGPNEARWDARFSGALERSTSVLLRFVPETAVLRDQSYAPAFD